MALCSPIHAAQLTETKHRCSQAMVEQDHKRILRDQRHSRDVYSLPDHEEGSCRAARCSISAGASYVEKLLDFHEADSWYRIMRKAAVELQDAASQL